MLHCHVDLGRCAAGCDAARRNLKAVTLQYRIAIDAPMNAGEGGLSATAVTPEPLVQLERAELPFSVVK